MIDIIHETYGGSVITVDGVSYSCEQFDNLTPDELGAIRDRMILKHQRESRAKESAIYDTFQPYIMKAVMRETRRDKKRNLAQMIRRMPEEDVIAVFTIYFDEILNKKNGDNAKNE